MSFFPKKPASRIGETQVVAFGEDCKRAFGHETYQIRIVANATCYFRIGDGKQKVSSEDPFLPAKTVEYFIVSPGQRIAVLAAEGDIGALWVTEMS